MAYLKNWRVLWVAIVVLLLVAGVLAFSLLKTRSGVIADINSFEDCADYGYPILESYPARCITSDGREFVQIITP